MAAADPDRVELRVMGVGASVEVHGAPRGTAARGAARLADLEARWSRFRPNSEISRLRGARGEAVVVSADTVELVTVSVTAWRATAGACDPTVAPALEALGYDRTFAALAPDGPAAPPTPAPGCGGIEIGADRVRLPPLVALDPGAIGKGLAGDIVCRELLAHGAHGVVVSVGGDVVVAGAPQWGGPWGVDVASPGGGAPLARLGLRGGAVATSAPGARRWRRGGVAVHHVVDPATGRPVAGGPRSATVVAGAGWWAEAWATALTVIGTDALDRLPAAHALVVDDDGVVHTTAGLAGHVLRDAA
jgi:FAD:protein FMN transferase